jgi:hypothetical protein
VPSRENTTVYIFRTIFIRNAEYAVTAGTGPGTELDDMPSNEERAMSEERRVVHPQEPAEGAQEDVEAPGVEKAGDPSNPATADAVGDEERSAHPDEPAEGGEDEVDEPGAGRPDNTA